MTYQEEEIKRMTEVSAEMGVKLAKLKKRNRVLVAIALVAIGIVVVDFLTRERGALLQNNLNNPDETIAAWRESGFIKTIDEPSATVVVDDDLWETMAVGEKNQVAATLSSYCAVKSGATAEKLIMKGQTSQLVLARIDSSGLTIQ